MMSTKTGSAELDAELRTERLVLRRFEADDFEAFFACVSRPDVTRFTSLEPLAREPAERAFDKRLADPPMNQAGQMFSRAVTVAENGRLIGEVMLFARDIDARQGEIGYMIHPDFQGKGYGLEAVRAMVGLGFECFEFHRIFGRCDAQHLASAALMEKLGMRREAHLREHAIYKGEWDELFIYAILEDEWAALNPGRRR